MENAHSEGSDAKQWKDRTSPARFNKMIGQEEEKVKHISRWPNFLTNQDSKILTRPKGAR